MSVIAGTNNPASATRIISTTISSTSVKPRRRSFRFVIIPDPLFLAAVTTVTFRSGVKRHPIDSQHFNSGLVNSSTSLKSEAEFLQNGENGLSETCKCAGVD